MTLRWPAWLVLLSLFLSACSGEPKSGPVEIKWDRDGCTHCGMALSDRRFAAQVRGGVKHQAFKFDDIGCAVEWLKKQPWANDATTGIWVMDYRTGKWLDARRARYIGGKTSPMAYGYAAVTDEPGSIDFEELKKRVLARQSHKQE
ncbi:MAG: nitrous oxide reductase accessory protein NosL [Sulfuricellaceae bacterium]